MTKVSKRISLKELTKDLGFKDYRRTQKWLTKRSIPCKKDGRGYYILKWHIDFSFCLEIAEDLKKRFPINWFKVFEATVEDKKMIQAVFQILPPNAVSNRRAANNKTHKFF